MDHPPPGIWFSEIFFHQKAALHVCLITHTLTAWPSLGLLLSILRKIIQKGQSQTPPLPLFYELGSQGLRRQL